MKRRVFLGSVITGAASTIAPNLFPTASTATEQRETPSWLETEPLLVISNYTDVSIFRRRVGRNPTWEDAYYRKEQSEEAVSKLKDLGVTLVVIPLYLGFGLEAEKEGIDDARKLTALLKRYEIRVGVYVGSTIMYETFLSEKPEAKEWFVQDYLGRPVIYDHQTYRKRVYFMPPGYREYIKGVLRVALEDLKVDLIHFDNTSMQAESAIFQHPLAVEDFRTYLQNRYTAEGLKKRLGHADVRHVEPPRVDWPVATIDDPLWQEWAEFRCQQLARYYGEMKEFIRRLNPNAAIATNPHVGISGQNTIWNQGVDYPTLVPQMDIVWCEEGDYAGTTAKGILVSKIRTYKMATILKKRILTYTTKSVVAEGAFFQNVPGGRVQMAESMAYNRQSLGKVGGGLAGYYRPEEERAYIRFFREYFDLYRGVETAADVAILYSHATMGFNNERPAVSFMLFAQTLIQAKVPFELIFDQHLKDLSKYRVLVLADQECLTDEQLALIRKYVQQGGGLGATEHTSLYTEWRRRRPDFGLKDLFQLGAPEWQGQDAPETVLNVGTIRHDVGSGRLAYVAEVKPAIGKPPAVPMTYEYWKLPENWEGLVDAVQWAAGGQMTLEVEAPLTVTAELLRQPETGKLLLHLINYHADRTPVVQNINVRLRKSEGSKDFVVLSPDAAAQTLTARKKEQLILPYLRWKRIAWWSSAKILTVGQTQTAGSQPNHSLLSRRAGTVASAELARRCPNLPGKIIPSPMPVSTTASPNVMGLSLVAGNTPKPTMIRANPMVATTTPAMGVGFVAPASAGVAGRRSVAQNFDARSAASPVAGNHVAEMARIAPVVAIDRSTVRASKFMGLPGIMTPL